MSDTVEQILRLKAALERAPDASDSEVDDEIAAHTNRGHKLERGARSVSARSLNVPAATSPETGAGVLDGGADLGIDVEHLLQPISDPAEVPNNPVIARTFRSPFLQQLSDELLECLVDERTMLAKVAKLLECALGDDDAQAMPQIMTDVEQTNPYPSPAANGHSGQNGGDSVESTMDDPKKFFHVPESQTDRNLGLSEEDANLLRERLQVVHQRLDEYVRCIEQVRSGFTTAIRLKRNVMNWCREINGDDYVKLDLDEQNGNDNAGLGDKPAKDYYHLPSPQEGQIGAEYD